MAVKSYRDLIAWQKAMEIVELVYKCTAEFPATERYGLTNQMRRSSVSIPSNIAEGQARLTREFQQFLRIAQGSLFELETQTEIATRLNFLTKRRAEDLLSKIGETSRIISGLLRSLKP